MSGDLHGTSDPALHTHLLQGNTHPKEGGVLVLAMVLVLVLIQSSLCVVRTASWSQWTKPRFAVLCAGSGFLPGPV